MDNDTQILLTNNNGKNRFTLFNPNDWPDKKSKLIIHSCAAQYGLLQNIALQIRNEIANSNVDINRRFADLKQQWNSSKWELSKCQHFAELPNTHLNILMFLTTIKTLLDLISQLLSTEYIVSAIVDGFHKRKGIIGGKCLHTLDNNATKTNKDKAISFIELINKHKSIWIDSAVRARDDLTHPEIGIIQIMFEMIIQEDSGDLVLKDIKAPTINNLAFNVFAEQTIDNLRSFSEDFINIIKSQSSPSISKT